MGRILARFALLILLGSAFSGCAYYNYYYNASKNFENAEKARHEASTKDKASPASVKTYDKVVESAAKMLLYYPGSKWEDDALTLIAKAYYRAGKYRSAIGKVDELNARYPESPLKTEAKLYKGLSLLKVAQADSARLLLNEVFEEQPVGKFAAEGLLGLGDHYFTDNRIDLALVEFRKAALAAGDDEWLRGEAWVRSGECLGMLKKYDEAVKLYDEILSRKIPRRLRFEASLQRAIALRESGRSRETIEACEKLLKDGAFLADFPRVEIELAKAYRAVGEIEQAKENLNRLIEAEKRGVVGAEARYLLGLIQWEVDKIDTAALSTLESVKSTERSAPTVALADSLINEIEILVKHYARLRFYERQFSLIDSARQGLRPYLASDSVWVDSSALLKAKNERPKAGKRDKPGKQDKLREENLAIKKMVEDAMAADTSLRKQLGEEVMADSLSMAPGDSDSISVSIDSTKIGLDSLAIAQVDSAMRAMRNGSWFALSEVHLFERNDKDSARHYLDLVLTNSPTIGALSRTLASKAYIAKITGDSATYDSIYAVIYQIAPDEAWKMRAAKITGQPVEKRIPERSEALIDSAEYVWRTLGDAETARLLYLLAAEIADSGDTIGGKALLASAYLTRTVLGQDSLAKTLYAEVGSKYGSTAYGKAASKYAPRGGGRNARPANNQFEVDPREMELEEDAVYNPEPEVEQEAILPAEKVEVPPEMITTPEILEDYLRTFYPFEAYGEQLRGRVEVEFVLTKRGEVRDPAVLKADPEGYGFGEAALQVLPSINYRPGRHKGNTVDVKMKQVFLFKYPE